MADGPPSPTVLPACAPCRRRCRSDAELISRSIDDPEQFAALFDRHASTVHRYLGRRVGELADDLLSETFLIAFRRRTAYRPEHVDVRPWLLGIATNLVHGHARTERRRYRALARAGAEPPRRAAGPDDVHARVDAAGAARPARCRPGRAQGARPRRPAALRLGPARLRGDRRRARRPGRHRPLPTQPARRQTRAALAPAYTPEENR